MFRVYDKKKKCWLQDDVYISLAEDMYASKHALFGTKKLSLMPDIRYVYQRDIGLKDKNGSRIFEGDICKADFDNIIGLIAYVPDHAAYYFLDYSEGKYYPLGINACKDLEIIGNNFENPELLK